MVKTLQLIDQHLKFVKGEAVTDPAKYAFTVEILKQIRKSLLLEAANLAYPVKDI